MRSISNTDDVIDSRSVIERIAELRQEFADALELEDGCNDVESLIERASNDDSHYMHDEAEELRALENLNGEGEARTSEWRYGVALVRDSYFEDYAMQLAEDIGAIPRDASWPANCIDWEQAARELRVDYTAIDFGDETYWMR